MSQQSNTPIDKSIFDSISKKISGMNPLASVLANSTLSNVDTWYDTGCMVLNSIISGSLFKGVPKGRMVIFTGPSMSGKTLIINKILANAQKSGVIPIIFDTEGAVDDMSAKGAKLDPSLVQYIPVLTVEECRNQVSAILDHIVENHQEGKFIISIDSLGNLASQKEIEDVGKDKSATDMGTRAKALKSMMRVIQAKAQRAGVTVLCSNHTYDNPTELYPSLVKQQAGGKGPIYIASVIVQLAAKSEKQDDSNASDKIISEAKSFSGSTLRALTVKNRFAPPFLECEMYLNFVTGLDKYSGLLSMAVNHGIIIQTGSTYTLPNGEKLGYYKNWKNNVELWTNTIIPGIEEKISKVYKYNAVEQEDETDEVTDNTIEA